MIGYVTLGTNDLPGNAPFYDALANGGTDEGAPGPRGEPDAQGNTFYAAYFRDRDGNKLNAFCMVQD